MIMKTRVLLSLLAVCLSIPAFTQQVGNGITPELTTMDQILPSGMYYYKWSSGMVSSMDRDFLISAKQTNYNLQVRVNNSLYLVGSTGHDRMYYRVLSNSGTLTKEWIGVASTKANTFTDTQRINARLGINVSPAYDLDVTGTGRITGNLLMSGKIGINTTNPTYNLDVNGVIRGKEVRVESNWADFVFSKEYKLPELSEVKAHINEHNRLPGMPSAEEVKENGIGISEATTLLLQKVEELTLYVIQQNEEIKMLKEQLKSSDK